MAMPSRLPSTTASAGSRPLPFRTRRRGKRRSVRIDVGELLERAASEVANIVNMVVLQQSRDAAALFRRHRNLQQHVTGSERLVVDLQGYPVVAEPLEGPHHAASQTVVAAMLIQDGRSPLTAQNLHRCD